MLFYSFKFNLHLAVLKKWHHFVSPKSEIKTIYSSLKATKAVTHAFNLCNSYFLSVFRSKFYGGGGKATRNQKPPVGKDPVAFPVFPSHQLLGLPEVLQLLLGAVVLSLVLTQVSSSRQLKASGDWPPAPLSRFYVEPVCSSLTRQGGFAL